MGLDRGWPHASVVCGVVIIWAPSCSGTGFRRTSRQRARVSYKEADGDSGSDDRPAVKPSTERGVVTLPPTDGV